MELFRWGGMCGLLAVALLSSSPARADGILDVWPDSVPPFSNIHNYFPNWRMAPASAFMLYECDDTWCAGCTTSSLRGLTMLNYGTAVGGVAGDIAGMYFNMLCGKYQSGTLTMTYAGVWAIGAGSYPAWTWAGNELFGQDPCDMTGKGCWCYPSLYTYVDIGSCPTNGASIQLGPGFNDILNPASPGGVSDSCGYTGPTWGAYRDEIKYITYVVKEANLEQAAPGDTITYTIYYGLLGSGNIANIRITDTLPQYTHWNGVATPAPDVGWNPDVGPPMRLRWTIPGPIATAGGGTSAITFQVTVDWGNEDWFEPGSGDVAAPEGARIENEAHASYEGVACAQTGASSNRTDTNVRRFLMWLMGDNDVLFSPSFGQPPDEMIYTVFVKNLSTKMTWWEVRLWDTVPPELDVWAADCGVFDPCVGWTMSPTGCAPATPVVLTPGSKTLIRWSLNMPPGMTLQVKWKARVANAAGAGDTAVNVLSLLELGRTAVVGGTGHSSAPKNFAHLAPIILPTTYVSYVSYGGDNWAQPDFGDALSFFPLNKKSQFELRGLTYAAADAGGWAGAGGNSASIGCLLGDCLGGFPGSPGPCPVSGIPSDPSSRPGCKAERIPARFHHAGPPVADPYQHLYKITSNSPVCWQAQPGAGTQCGDFMTYAPATTLTYAGLLHYFWRNSYNATIKGSGTELFFMNTTKDPYGNIDPSLPTTVHLFKFNYGTLDWDYRTTYELGAEGAACDPTTLLGDEGAFRSISSQGQLIVWQGYQALSTLGCGCPCYNNSCMIPTRETGNTVSGVGSGTFYGVVQGYGVATKIALGNVGGADATYKVYQYVPRSTAGPGEIPVNMRGTSGIWRYKGSKTTPAGFASAKNPTLFNEEGNYFDASSTAAFKVVLESGGPIQMHSGARVFAGWGGGAALHAANPAGSQTGSEFWVNQIHNNDGTDGASPQIYAISVFCAKTGMAIRMETDDGRTETYTTNGADQCVSFIGFAEPAWKRNIRITRLPAVPGDVITQYINAGPEKGYTAPFLVTGVHYSIIAPPVVFSGQDFWITVVVIEQGGATKTDYTGTSAFTSSDPGARMQLADMGTWTYVWQPTDNGVRIFVNVRLYAMGLQTIIGRDIFDGSISGVTAVMVVAADVKLSKRPQFGVFSSGDTVEFKVCWSNYSSGTAANFVITDAIPQGTTYVPEALSNSLCDFTGSSPPSLVPAGQAAHSSSTSATMPPASAFTTTGGVPPPGVRWLRWTIQQISVQTTGCVRYRVRID